jgi:glucose/arabinose dehydrogenase
MRGQVLDPTPIDTTIISRSEVGDIPTLLGIAGPVGSGGPQRVAPDVGVNATYTPAQTPIVLYYIISWLYQNGYLNAATAVASMGPVIDAHEALVAGDEAGAITAFTTFVTTVTGHISSGAVAPGIGQALIDLANAAIAQLVPVELQLEVVASGLDTPLYLTAPAADPRLFIVTKNGTIRIVQSGQLLATPFLNIASKISTNSERGLLSVAFHPSYSTNGFFYVCYTNLNGDIVIERYTVSANSNVANPASAKPILLVPHPTYANHNGGHALFGPDGMLYLATGDGGGAGDPSNNGQNKNTLLGKVLRIDVNQGDPYAIPADNPFVNQGGARGEIWALGLRNPWRIAFGWTDQQFYIADVGQGDKEEVNVAPRATGGVNYGWVIMEGDQCYAGSSCNQTGLTLPVLTYDTHVDGTCSVTGGIVYRGQITQLRGHYFYGDYCAGWVRSFRFVNGQATEQMSWDIGSYGRILSFGEDGVGEMYLLSDNGSVYRFVQAN